MSVEVLAQETAVSKTQRTVKLPDDLDRIIRQFEKQTGASFTRIALAALLQYFLDRPEGPDPEWMALTVSLDDGEIGLAEIVEDREQIAAAERAYIDQLESDEKLGDHFMKLSASKLKMWRSIRKGPSADVVKNLVGNWTVSGGKSSD